MGEQTKCLCGECATCKKRAYMTRYREEHREEYNARMREWYALNADTHRETVKRSRRRRIEQVRAYDNTRTRTKDPVKDRARAAVRRAVARGEIAKQPCEVAIGCEGRMEAHHEDYSKPFDVRWLCQKHHAELHRTVAA